MHVTTSPIRFGRIRSRAAAFSGASAARAGSLALVLGRDGVAALVMVGILAFLLFV